MHQHFTIKPLAGPLVDKAYPFAAALGVRDLEAWRAFVASYTAGAKGGSGAIVAENPLGYLCGVLFHQVNRHKKDGTALVCDPFLVAAAPRYETPVRVLLEAADKIAVEHGCKWVRVVLPATGDPLGAEGMGCEGALFRAGYALENLSFRRRRALPVRTGRAPDESHVNGKTRTLVR